MYICICSKVTDKQLQQVINAGANTLTEVQKKLAIATVCGRCIEATCEIIEANRVEAISGC
jgi:bacterioferritin-associated ferredoxin